MQPWEIIGEKLLLTRSRDQCVVNWCTNFNCSLELGFGDGLGLWLSSGHLLSEDRLGLRFWGYGLGVRGRKVKSRDCALANDLVRAKGRRVSKTKILFLVREGQLLN